MPSVFFPSARETRNEKQSSALTTGLQPFDRQFRDIATDVTYFVEAYRSLDPVLRFGNQEQTAVCEVYAAVRLP